MSALDRLKARLELFHTQGESATKLTKMMSGATASAPPQPQMIIVSFVGPHL
jgi:hypothetical protein